MKHTKTLGTFENKSFSPRLRSILSLKTSLVHHSHVQSDLYTDLISFRSERFKCCRPACQDNAVVRMTGPRAKGSRFESGSWLLFPKIYSYQMLTTRLFAQQFEWGSPKDWILALSTTWFTSDELLVNIQNTEKFSVFPWTLVYPHSSFT